MQVRFIVVLALAALGAGCAKEPSQSRPTFSELTRAEPERLRQIAAPDYALYIRTRESRALTLDEAKAMRDWSRALNAETEYREVDEREDRTTAKVLNRNDISRQLEFDGWMGRLTFWFDKDGRVREQLYEPIEQTPSFDEKLRPALEWARTNRPSQLREIWVNDQFVYTPEAARAWVALLKEWRAASGRPPIE